MRAVLFGLLRHEPHVGHVAHGSWVEGSVGFAVLDGLLVDGCVTGIGDDGFGVLENSFLVPHLSSCADHCGHRRIDDDVGRNVEVCDALV